MQKRGSHLIEHKCKFKKARMQWKHGSHWIDRNCIFERANRMPCKCVSQLIEHNYIFKKRIGGKRGSHLIEHNGNFKKERMQCEEGQGPRLIDRNSIALHCCFFATFLQRWKMRRMYDR